MEIKFNIGLGSFKWFFWPILWPIALVQKCTRAKTRNEIYFLYRFFEVCCVIAICFGIIQGIAILLGLMAWGDGLSGATTILKWSILSSWLVVSFAWFARSKYLEWQDKYFNRAR
jgi:uncharacterized membrane protein